MIPPESASERDRTLDSALGARPLQQQAVWMSVKGRNPGKGNRRPESRRTLARGKLGGMSDMVIEMTDE